MKKKKLFKKLKNGLKAYRSWDMYLLGFLRLR